MPVSEYADRTVNFRAQRRQVALGKAKKTESGLKKNDILVKKVKPKGEKAYNTYVSKAKSEKAKQFYKSSGAYVWNLSLKGAWKAKYGNKAYNFNQALKDSEVVAEARKSKNRIMKIVKESRKVCDSKGMTKHQKHSALKAAIEM